METWEIYASGGRRHREYVDVVASFSCDGSITPAIVMWRDGRTFRVGEAMECSRFANPAKGTETVRYEARIGRIRTEPGPRVKGS